MIGDDDDDLELLTQLSGGDGRSQSQVFGRGTDGNSSLVLLLSGGSCRDGTIC